MRANNPKLREVARLYRAFSALDGGAEFAIYDAIGPFVAFVACDKRHPLKEFESPSEIDCAVCRERVPEDATIHACQACHFALCEACHGARAPINGRDELITALRAPPTTTTHVNLCLVKPDTLAAGCSYARMELARGGAQAAEMVGTPTIFLSHAWRYTLLAVVDSLLVGPTKHQNPHPFPFFPLLSLLAPPPPPPSCVFPPTQPPVAKT